MRICSRPTALIPLAVLLGGLNLPAQQAQLTFTNPVVSTGADPWVVEWQGAYYLSQSRGGRGVWVIRSEQLHQLGSGRAVRVWTPPPSGLYSKEIWAPELHRLHGKWWIYVAADDGQNANHRMHVLEGHETDPLAPFTYKGKIAAPTDRWAIDGTVLEMPDGRLYLIWSGWEGFENVAQHLYIAPMSNPWTICGERVRISSPELPWELNGRPLINEGPQVLWNKDKLFIVYSASGSWTDNYCLGLLQWNGGDVLNPASWTKHPKALFSKTDAVFGPGHCSFVKSGEEHWLVYHSARHSGAGWNRRINMQPFRWAEDGSPYFGMPIAAGVPIGIPAGDMNRLKEPLLPPIPAKDRVPAAAPAGAR